MLLSQHSEKGHLTISTNERGLNLLNSIGSLQIIFSVSVHLEHFWIDYLKLLIVSLQNSHWNITTLSWVYQHWTCLRNCFPEYDLVNLNLDIYKECCMFDMRIDKGH